MKYKKIISALFILIIIILFSGIAIALDTITKSDVHLSLVTNINLKSGQGKTIDSVYTVAQGSSFCQTYNIKNSTDYSGSIEVAIYEKITSSSGKTISDWTTFTSSVTRGSATTITGKTVNMDTSYGKSVTFSYRLMFKLNGEWNEYSSSSNTVKLYLPVFSATYTTDANPVGLSDFLVYFGGKITLSSGVKVGSVKVYDSMYGLIAELGDIKEKESKKFQKDLAVSVGVINSYLIVEYTDLLSNEIVRTELPEVKITGKIIDAPIETKISMNVTSPKTYLETAQNIDLSFEFKNDTQYDIITAFIYQLDDMGKATAEPILNIGSVLKGSSATLTKNTKIEPDKIYSYAIYAYVEDSSTPFKATYDFSLSSIPPCLEIQRSIEGAKLPFYTDTVITYTAKNISNYEVTNVTITDGILGEVYKTDSIKSGQQVTFTAKGKFSNDFTSQPTINLVIKDDKNTSHTFFITKQIFMVERKTEPSMMMHIENINAKNKESSSFDVVLLNDGNTNFIDLELIDTRNGALLGTFSLLNIGDKQIVSLSGQNYKSDSNIKLMVKCKTDTGQEMEFNFDAVHISNPLIKIIIISAALLVVIGCAVFLTIRKRNRNYSNNRR